MPGLSFGFGLGLNPRKGGGAPPGYVWLRGQNPAATYTILRGQTSAGVYVNLAGKA